MGPLLLLSELLDEVRFSVLLVLRNSSQKLLFRSAWLGSEMLKM
jgi:hypothetical protein